MSNLLALQSQEPTGNLSLKMCSRFMYVFVLLSPLFITEQHKSVPANYTLYCRSQCLWKYLTNSCTLVSVPPSTSARTFLLQQGIFFHLGTCVELQCYSLYVHISHILSIHFETNVQLHKTLTALSEVWQRKHTEYGRLLRMFTWAFNRNRDLSLLRAYMYLHLTVPFVPLVLDTPLPHH